MIKRLGAVQVVFIRKGMAQKYCPQHRVVPMLLKGRRAGWLRRRAPVPREAK